MGDVTDYLKSDKDSSNSKSYLLGLERGRIWAEDYADYFDMRRWSDTDPEDADISDLPDGEHEEYKLLSSETPLEGKTYLKGWIDGVRQIREKY